MYINNNNNISHNCFAVRVVLFSQNPKSFFNLGLNSTEVDMSIAPFTAGIEEKKGLLRYSQHHRPPSEKRHTHDPGGTL